MTIPADTRALRRELRARRQALSPPARIAAAQQFAARLHTLPGLPREGYAAGYWAMGGELPLLSWQATLPAGLVYCLPVLCDDDLLRFAPWRPGDTLVTNRFGIPEPDLSPSSLVDARDLALAVVPLVGFDAACNRVGMGGGWYDRSFAFRREAIVPPLLVGAAYEVQRVDALQPAPWDVALDAVCTEAATYTSDTHP